MEDSEARQMARGFGLFAIGIGCLMLSVAIGTFFGTGYGALVLGLGCVTWGGVLWFLNRRSE
jgi:hypothetical protein